MAAVVRAADVAIHLLLYGALRTKTCTTCGPEPITATITYPVNGHPYINGGARPTPMPAQPGEISGEYGGPSDGKASSNGCSQSGQNGKQDAKSNEGNAEPEITRTDDGFESSVRPTSGTDTSEAISPAEVVVEDVEEVVEPVESVEVRSELEVELVVKSDVQSDVVLVVHLEVELVAVTVEVKFEVEPEVKLVVIKLDVVELVEIELDLELTVLIAAVPPARGLSVVVELEVVVSLEDWMLLMVSLAVFSVLATVVVSVTIDVTSDVDSSADDGVPSELNSVDVVAGSGVVQLEEDRDELAVALVVGSVDSVDSEDGPVGSV
ncbi:hypothetical protein FPRO06_10996 [Fusarium proliferatum]|nr:hypothetical protein FPRO06_10996 [Fusarium proliferatum]